MVRGERDSYEVEKRYIHRDGSHVWVHATSSVVKNALGQPLYCIAIVEDITERKRVEEQLRTTADRLKAILENAPVGIAVYDPEGRLVDPNAAYQRICGYSAEELKGKKFTDYTHPDDVAKNLQLYEQFASGELQSYEIEKRYIRKDGKIIWVRVIVSRINEQFNVGIIEDITERKQAQEALGESERFLRMVIDLVPHLIFVKDEESRYVLVNQACAEAYGTTPLQMVGRYTSEIVSNPDYAEMFMRADREVIESGKPKFIPEEAIRDTSGGMRFHQTNKVPFVRSTTGETALIGVSVDITDHKRAEQALRESEEKFRLLLNSTAEAIYGVDLQGNCTICNPACLRLLGYQAPEDLLGKNMHKVMHHSHANGVPYPQQECQIYTSFREGKPSHVTDEVLWRADGTSFPAEYWSYPMHKGAELIGSVVTFLDISDRKRAEQSLRQSEERYRVLFDRNLAAVFHSSGGKLLDCNEAMCRMFGYSREEMLALDLRTLYCDVNDRDTGQKLLYQNGYLKNNQVELRRKDGIVITVLANLNVLHEEGRQAPGVVGVMLEITEVRRLQERLLQSQKLEAIGRLAGGVAHDFNNLLMVITSYTEMLQSRLASDDQARTDTQQVLKAADRAASLTQQMLAFSRKQMLSPKILDLNSVVDETAKMLKRLIGENIELRFAWSKPLWRIMADPGQMAQVLMNLSINARDAMPRGGTLTIATGNVSVDEGGIERRLYVSPGDYVRLSVTDTGIGISKDLQQRIFDPFFTTKEVGKGTGLGLATVYGIVKQSGGYLWVNSELGHGSCFTVLLPRVMHAIVPDMPAKSEAQPRGAGTLLVAEDEEALREAMCDYLRSLGYTVLAASSGKAALSAASEHEGRIDLLITDLVMPGISGRELSQILGGLRPDLKTICMSGYSDDAVLRQGIHEMGETFLQKPFSLGTLARKVRDTLGRTETVQ